LRASLVLGLLGLLILSFSARAEEIAGQASVIDGDTIEIVGTRIRLHGIDAPESRQTCRDRAGRDYRCGQRAAFALSDWVGRATVSCRQTDIDRYGRVVAICRAKGADVNQWMVRQGWAIAYRQYGQDYVPDEQAAQRAGVGMWAGTFASPSDWRKGRR
jgi:endonuclease YncB( thermonuclease family)